ncbi:MAG: sensor histidine kinase [Lewinella sp.]|jgi:signal transduction histidine kinase|uniref:HAMP domain-containing sensor histidine kinase n=1 Tax=Lewinella sp. TaxID=2004506 RepID=UPI003D6AD9FD
MNKKANDHFSLYWNIAFTLLLLLLGLGAGYIFVTSIAARTYVQEINQQLYGDVAKHIVKETQPLKDGQPDTSATHDIMHSMMVINPSLEVYLLDTEGEIIDYVVPYSKVKLDRVDMEPITTFLTSKTPHLILGDDPKQPGTANIFSAAPIYENEQLRGYAYVILAGEARNSITSTLSMHYILCLGGRLFYLILVAALLIGLLAFWWLTRNLRRIISVLKRFQEGDYEARISKRDQGSLAILGDTFNEMAEKVTESIEQLKSVDRLRQELIANVSHDLRTPLAIIQGYIETLQMKEGKITSEERKQYLETVMASSEKLSRLIAQLFEYSKLEAQQIVPQKEPFPIQELCQDIIFKYQVLAQEKNIALGWNAPHDLPMVFADIGLVERVLQNLLDNALRHTPAGGEVSIQLNNTPEGVRIMVADTGPGIPEAQQAHIFERYRQLETKKATGSGLGLAIVKKILEIHQATIHVRNREQNGAEFWFQLPLAVG